MFVQQLDQANNEENTKASHYSICDQLISLAKGQKCQKQFMS